MFLNQGPFTEADYSERALVGKILLAHLFNAEASCNRENMKAFREFIQLATGTNIDKVGIEDIWTTIEFGVVRAVESFDNTQLDALISIKGRILCAIECKYCDYFKSESDQLERIGLAVEELNESGIHEQAVMVLIAPEQEFASIVTDIKRRDVRDEIRARMKKRYPCRLVSWEMVRDIICRHSLASEATRLNRYFDIRNTKSVYPITIEPTPKVRTCNEWTQIFDDKLQLPTDLKPSGKWPPTDRTPHSTAELGKIFSEHRNHNQQQIFEVLYEIAGSECEDRDNIQALGRKNGKYINVQRRYGPGQNDFLARPSSNGLAIIFDEQKCRDEIFKDHIKDFIVWDKGEVANIHPWFRRNARHLRVWEISDRDWNDPSVQKMIKEMIKRLVINRSFRRKQ